MGVLTVIGAFLVALIVPAVSRLLSDEYKEWRPHLVRKVIRFSVRFLPQSERGRYEEEFSAHIEDTPGDLSKLIVALSLIPAAFRMSDRPLLALGLKRALDIFIAVGSLALLMPLLISVAIFIRIESRGMHWQVWPLGVIQGSLGLAVFFASRALMSCRSFSMCFGATCPLSAPVRTPPI
ncbi:hypothetical protein [Rhizobium laguerreae]|uniref:hypothetical protein n=1 Tax=Rhizobium laguerreae TaxID=1076926 RepID=UPI0031BA05ED